MSTSTVTTIRFLEVDSKPGAAKYVKIVEIPVDPNGPGYVAIINQAAGLDELPPPSARAGTRPGTEGRARYRSGRVNGHDSLRGATAVIYQR